MKKKKLKKALHKLWKDSIITMQIHPGLYIAVKFQIVYLERRKANIKHLNAKSTLTIG